MLKYVYIYLFLNRSFHSSKRHMNAVMLYRSFPCFGIVFLGVNI